VALVSVVIIAAVAGALLVTRSQAPDEGTRLPTVHPTPQPPVDVTWDDLAGVKVPVSRTHGPLMDNHGLATGYTRTEPGAALAAANMLVRSSPAVSPTIYEATITAQGTGANVGALKLTVAAQHAQLESIGSSARAQLVGYVIRSFDSQAGAATVDVLLTAPDSPADQHLLQVTVTLQWQADDWHFVAPPRGDWASVSTSLTAEPPATQRFEDL
jgi:hypothetical protein